MNVHNRRILSALEDWYLACTVKSSFFIKKINMAEAISEWECLTQDWDKALGMLIFSAIYPHKAF